MKPTLDPLQPFDGTQFRIWAEEMRQELADCDLGHTLTDSTVDPEEDRRAWLMIVKRTNRDLVPEGPKTARALLSALEETYASVSNEAYENLQYAMYDMRIADDESLPSYAVRWQVLLRRLAQFSHCRSNSDLRTLIINGILKSPSRNRLAGFLQLAQPEKGMPVERLISQLIASTCTGVSETEKALLVKNSSPSKAISSVRFSSKTSSGLITKKLSRSRDRYKCYTFLNKRVHFFAFSIFV